MKNSPQKAFTLIETMIAITILTLSIVGPMVTADRSIVAAETARDQLSASYLAQEGIEYVRGIRDDQYLALYSSGNTNAAWSNFLNGSLTSCRSPGVCTLGSLKADGTLNFCPNGVSGCAPFTLVTPGTPFTRTIQLVDVSATDERIISTVSWSFHSTSYVETVTDHLTPWQ